MSRALTARPSDYVRPGVSTPPTPEPGEDDWPNAFAWRSDYWIDSGMVDEATAGVIAMLEIDVDTVLETGDAADIRVEDSGGMALAYRLVEYDDSEEIARIAVLLPALASDTDTLIRVYAGKDDAADEPDVTGLYAAYLQVLDGITGDGLTSAGRAVTPTGVSAGALSIGWPAGVYDGAAVMSSLGASDWLAGYASISVMAIVECDAGQQGITGAVYANSSLPEGTNGGQDNLVLSRLATTSGGKVDVWHLKQQTSPDNATAYSLGESNTAAAELAVLHASWASGEAPVIRKNGAEISYSVEQARTGTTRKLSDGCHVGKNLRGKITEIRVGATVPSATKALLESLLLTTPASVLGRGAWYGPDDEMSAPIVAMPVRATAQSGVAEDIDVAAAAVGSGTLQSVTQGQRGTVSIVGGEARYTATGDEPGTDWFEFTVSDGTFSSTGRCDVTVTGVDDPTGPDEDELPTPQSNVTLNNQTEFNNWKAGNPPAGQHATVTFNVALGTLALANGTEVDPIVIKADTTLGRTAVPGDITGDHIRIHGFDCGNNNVGECTGSDVWFIRCKWAGTSTGIRVRAKSPGFRAWYCEMQGNGRQIAFDTAANAGGAGLMGVDGHVKGCYFHDVAPGGANGTETITVGFANSRTAVDSGTIIEDCLFEDCNLGGAEDETIAIKSSNCIVRNCTLNRCRFVQVRHGTGNLIDRVIHNDSPTGGISVFDGSAANPNIVTSCVTTGGSRIRVYCGDVEAAGDDPNWWVGAGAAKPRAYTCGVYHADCEDAGIIGYTFASDPPNPTFPAYNTSWLQNRGVDPTLNGAIAGGARQVGTVTAGTAPIAYSAPSAITAGDVGPGASA